MYALLHRNGRGVVVDVLDRCVALIALTKGTPVPNTGK